MPPSNSNSGGYYTSASQPLGPTAAPAAAPRGNWWERLLPTIGGIIGGIGGTAAGALVPGADLTGVSEVGGGIAGASGGDALGQQFENDLTGSKGSTAIAGLEGGAGQAVGGIAGKALGGALGAASGGLSKVVADRAGNVDQIAKDVPWQNIVGSAAAKNADLGGTLDKMASYGIDTSPDALAKVTPQLTGPEGAVLSDLVRGGMQNSTAPVDLTGTVTLAKNMAGSPELASEGPTVGKAFVNTINNVLGLSKDGTLADNTAPDIYNARQLIMNKAYDKGVTPALSSAYHDVAQSLDTALTNSGVDQAVSQAGVSPEQFATLHAISPQLANDTTAAADQGVGALRSLQHPFVNADNLVKAQQYNLGGQLPGTLESDINQATSDATSGGVISKPTMDALGGHPVTKLGATAINAATSTPVIGPLAKVTGKLAASKIVPALTRAGAIAASNLPNDVGSPTAGGVTGQPTNGITGQGGAMAPTATAQDPTQQLYAALLAQLQAQPADAQTSSLVSGLNTLAPQVQKQELAAPVISNLLNTYGQAGGAQGLGGGLISQLTAGIPGTAANTYQKAQSSAADSLASLLGITPQAAAQVLPQLMQSQQTAANPQATLQSILGGIGGGGSGMAMPTLSMGAQG